MKDSEKKMKNKLAFRACWVLLTLVYAKSLLANRNSKIPSAPPVANSQSFPKSEREERLVIACDSEDGKTTLEILKARARV